MTTLRASSCSFSSKESFHVSLLDQKASKSKDVQKHQKNMWHFRDMPIFLGLTMEINKKMNPILVLFLIQQWKSGTNVERKRGYPPRPVTVESQAQMWQSHPGMEPQEICRWTHRQHLLNLFLLTLIDHYVTWLNEIAGEIMPVCFIIEKFLMFRPLSIGSPIIMAAWFHWRITNLKNPEQWETPKVGYLWGSFLLWKNLDM